MKSKAAWPATRRVAMVAVIGVPDALRGGSGQGLRRSRAMASTLAPNWSPTSRPTSKPGCPATNIPREIEFLDALPMTITGKIMRRELRNRRSPG